MFCKYRQVIAVPQVHVMHGAIAAWKCCMHRQIKLLVQTMKDASTKWAPRAHASDEEDCMRKGICSLTALLITCTAHSMLIVLHLEKNTTCRLQPIIMPPTTIMLVANCHPYCNSYCQSYCSVSCNITLQLQRQRGRTAQHEFQETCHFVTSYFM